MEKTLGEKRVRTDFNVSFSDAVTGIKFKSAELINILKEWDCPEGADINEFNRLKSLAMTAYEEASMWATKTVTTTKN